jgi:hypothetical protein
LDKDVSIFYCNSQASDAKCSSYKAISGTSFVILNNWRLRKSYFIRERRCQNSLFEFLNLHLLENYGQIYVRLNAIETFYKRLIDNKVSVHPNVKLELKSWGQLDFSILDSQHSLITFGKSR